MQQQYLQMMASTSKQSFILISTSSLLAGLISWFLVVILVNDKDAMGHAEYFFVGFPLMLMTSALLGWKFGLKAWHCGFLMLGTQLLTGLITIDSDLNLLPIGIFIFFVLAVVCSAPAVAFGLFAKRIKK